jgi:hypothetical protein
VTKIFDGDTSDDASWNIGDRDVLKNMEHDSTSTIIALVYPGNTQAHKNMMAEYSSLSRCEAGHREESNSSRLIDKAPKLTDGEKLHIV